NPVERALDDYREGLKAVYPDAHYVTLNFSSPNTPGLRSLQFGALLYELLDGLMVEREELTAQHRKRVPLALKVAPDLDSQE
ncbi:quinone-dependent dihydroorotate dehydrogenase, partial [Methylococcus sp. S1B]